MVRVPIGVVKPKGAYPEIASGVGLLGQFAALHKPVNPPNEYFHPGVIHGCWNERPEDKQAVAPISNEGGPLPIVTVRCTINLYGG
jgi:hypothetical protein